MKNYQKVFVVTAISILTCLIRVQPVYADAHKTINIEIENDYKSCTFLLEFEKGGEYNASIVSPDGDKYLCDKIDDMTMRCVIEKVSSGTWKVKATSGDLDKIGKISVTVSASKEADKNIISDIRVGKDIVGLNVYMKDDYVCAKWTDDTCGNVQITVKDLDKNEIIDNCKVTEREYECQIPPDVKNISVGVVPSESAGIKGAEKTYTINTSVNDMDAEVILPKEYYINEDSVTAEVSMNLPYGYQILDNDIMIAKSEPMEAGFYTIDIPLQSEGEHNIQFYVVDAEGNMESTAQSYVKDTVAPDVTLDSEYDGMQVNGSSIVISGSVRDFKEIRINENVITVTTDGHFESECSLHSGENEIELVACDAAGNETYFSFSIAANGNGTNENSSRANNESSGSTKWKICIILTIILVIVILIKNNGNGKKSKKEAIGKTFKNGQDDDSIANLFEEEENSFSDDVLAQKGDKLKKTISETVDSIPSIVKDTPSKKKFQIVKKNRIPGVVKDIMVCTLILIVCVACFQKVLIIGYTPTESMAPTLQVGDLNIGLRGAYKNNEPQRGDIVSFYYEGTKELLCKRIVGLPGETISFSSGYVYINGQLLDESKYLDKDIETNCVDSFEVPEGSYFVMGDNREASFDSRFWESPYVSKGSITGKCILIFPTHVFHKDE